MAQCRGHADDSTRLKERASAAATENNNKKKTNRKNIYCEKTYICELKLDTKN